MAIYLRYTLSVEAETDLDEIYDYTLAQFGEGQAVKYLVGIDDLLELLCSNHDLGRVRNDIRAGLRSLSYQSHVIFYTIREGDIWIVRLLHARRDVLRFLPNA